MTFWLYMLAYYVGHKLPQVACARALGREGGQLGDRLRRAPAARPPLPLSQRCRKGSSSATEVAGEVLQAVLRKGWIGRTPRSTAFALVRSDGSVVSWGMPNWGGDTSAVQEELYDVQMVEARP